MALDSTSMSYPNLPTRYLFHRVSARVSGLPEGPFSTTEDRPGGQLLTRWAWKYAHEVPCDLCSSTSGRPELPTRLRQCKCAHNAPSVRTLSAACARPRRDLAVGFRTDALIELAAPL
eukprot:350197-Chlamydomonas_euryale.AAC.1